MANSEVIGIFEYKSKDVMSKYKKVKAIVKTIVKKPNAEPREIVWRFSKEGLEQFEKALTTYMKDSNINIK